MPSRNRPELVRQAVASVQRQRHRNWELLIVDDAGDAEAAAVLASFDDPRIRVMRTDARAGSAGARNIALPAVRGELIAYLDDDNLMGPLWLAAVVWAFDDHPAYDLCYGAVALDGDHLGRDEPGMRLEPWDRQGLLLGNVVDQSALAHRTSVASIGYDADALAAPDWDFVVRATRDRDALAVPVLAALYRTRHPGRMTRSPDMARRCAVSQQRFSRRGPLRVLVLDDGSGADHARIAAWTTPLAARGDELVRIPWSAVDAADRIDVELRRTRVDLALVGGAAEQREAIRRRRVPYLACGPDAGGDEHALALAVPAVADGRRTALLQALDRVRAQCAQLPVLPPIADDLIAPNPGASPRGEQP